MVLAVALAVCGFLAAPDLRSVAEGMAPGFWRTAALVGARPIAATSGFLRLDRPLRLVDEWRKPADDGGDTTAAGAAGAAAGAGTQVAPSVAPPGSAAHPLQVWVGGDSMVERVGEALINRGDALGVLHVQMVSKVSSGLCRPDFFDWPGTVARVASTQRPDVSVVMFGGNDYQDMVVNGKDVTPFTPTWTKEYERRVAQIVQTLTADGGRVYWLGAPVMRDPQKSRRVAQLDALYRRVVARFPRATYVDTWSLLSDANGHYVAYRANGSGTMERIREPDGEHLTYLGGDRLAAVIVTGIRQHWDTQREVSRGPARRLTGRFTQAVWFGGSSPDASCRMWFGERRASVNPTAVSVRETLVIDPEELWAVEKCPGRRPISRRAPSLPPLAGGGT